jgi:hypothetical protein
MNAMRIIRIISVLTLFIAIATLDVDAQCKAFAKNDCLPRLNPYVHDGNYHAAVLVEGEEAELYKTFYSDMEYRLTIVGESKLPDVEFKVLDENTNILYSNKDNNYAKTWDFKLESSKQLKLIVKVTTLKKPGDVPASGCVAIMFGFKVKK